MDPKVTAEEVAQALREFIRLHSLYKSDHGIKNTIGNIHEVCNSMTDKHGRICREIKHAERKDPRPNFPQEMGEHLAGYVNYGLMLMRHYSVDFATGMIKELEKASAQHKETP